MTGIEVPLELAALLCAGTAVAGAWAGQLRAHRRLDPRRAGPVDPAGSLPAPEATSPAVDLAARRNARRDGSHAVLQARIDQLGTIAGGWNADTRDAVREHVAAVMRAGLRRGDQLALAGRESFTIIVPGADERAALHIANRLRRVLAQLHLPQLGEDARLTATFGVAAERFGDGADGLNLRARAALDAALARGEDHVVAASEIEEVILLPAPASPPPAASAA